LQHEFAAVPKRKMNIGARLTSFVVHMKAILHTLHITLSA